jgi:hypothetical protein
MVDEQQIAVVRNVNIVSFGDIHYDLYLTDKRFAAVHILTPSADLKYEFYAGGGVGSVLNDAVLALRRNRQMKRIEKSGKTNLGDLTLNELLEGDKKNFSIAYEDIVWLKLNKDNLNIRAKKNWKIFHISDLHYSELLKLLPIINGLKDKLS